MQAVAADNLAVVRFLLRKGADIHHTSDAGSTTLIIAVGGSHSSDMIRTLVQHEADPDICNKSGDSARSIARKRGNEKIREALGYGQEKDKGVMEAPLIRVRAEPITDKTSSAYWEHYYS